jgi:class 3 adenylate cyclase
MQLEKKTVSGKSNIRAALTEEFTEMVPGDVPGRVKRGVEQEGKTVLFADLTDSTRLFESEGNVVATQLVTQCTQILGRHFVQAGGRLVKYLGDGVLALFDDGVMAVDAAARVRDLLYDFHFEQVANRQLAFKIGIELGSIIEQQGDCYGDAVNVAARLSDRAEANEILLGETLYYELPESRRMMCHSLDRIVIKGKSEPIRVWRLDWKRTAETTVTIPFELLDERVNVALMQRIDLDLRGRHLQLLPSDGPLVIGRNENCGLHLNDRRVSRRHARIEWVGGRCTLTDFSSNGTWVNFGSEAAPIILKRDSCVLHGQGVIGLGSSPEDFTTATLSFQVISEESELVSNRRRNWMD